MVDEFHSFYLIIKPKYWINLFSSIKKFKFFSKNIDNLNDSNYYSTINFGFFIKLELH